MLTAIKEIAHIKNHKLTMQIPEEFNYKKVEVLILPFEEPVHPPPTESNKNLMDEVFKDARQTVISTHINVDAIMTDMNNGLS